MVIAIAGAESGGITPPAGDIGGTTADPTVVGIDGVPLLGTLTAGQTWVLNAGGTALVPQSPAGVTAAAIEATFTGAGLIYQGTGAGTGTQLQLLAANEATFTAASQILWGTGAGTGALITLLAANETLFTAANQILWGTGAGTGALITLLAAIESLFTANGQVLQGTGAGTGGLITLLAASEKYFTAGGQILWGTGAGTGALVSLVTAIEDTFTAAGELIVGTGFGTGTYLVQGANGTFLGVSGGTLGYYTPTTGISGGSSQTLLGAPVAITTSSTTTVLTSPVLPIGKYLVIVTAAISGVTTAGELDFTLASGTATATGYTSGAVRPSTGGSADLTVTFPSIVVVTVAGTILMQYQAGSSIIGGNVINVGPIAGLPATFMTITPLPA